MNKKEYHAPTMEVIVYAEVMTGDVIQVSGDFGSTDGKTDDEW